MKLNSLLEATVFPKDVTVDEILRMFDAARRGVSILNRIKDVNQRKKHASQIFKNLNRIRGMLMRLTEPEQD